MTHPNSPSLAEALTAALGDVTQKPQDRAAVRLAELYAEQVDESPESLAKLGPLLLGVLEALGMSPRARAAIMSKGGRNERDSGAEHAADCKCLPCQRKRRAVRRDRAAPMDPAAG